MHRDRLRGERLVELDDVEVADLRSRHGPGPCGWRGSGRCPSPPGRRRRRPSTTTRASGFRPSARARSASTSSTADAPSLMPELLPAVTDPPSRLNAGLSFASASADVSARGCSSRVDGRGLALPPGDLDGDDLVVEAAGLDRRDGATLALEREGVLALAVDAVALGHVLRGLAHRKRVVQLGELRVEEAPAERRVLELARAAIPGARPASP